MIKNDDKAETITEGREHGDTQEDITNVGEETPSVDIVYQEIKERLEVQLKQIDSLDGKTGNLLFMASVVLGIGATAQALLLGLTGSPLVMLFFSIPIVFYSLSMFFALRSWVIRPYFRDPEPRPLRDYYLTKEPPFTIRRLLAHFISCYEWNTTVIKKKVGELRFSMRFFLAEVITLAVVLVIRPWVVG
jgi:hypothetical protein